MILFHFVRKIVFSQNLDWEKLPFTKNRGLAFLLYKLFNNSENGGKSPKTEYSTYDVGFIIAPVFNAGRLKDANGSEASDFRQ